MSQNLHSKPKIVQNEAQNANLAGSATVFGVKLEAAHATVPSHFAAGASWPRC